ncbi:MAG: hypothetical protein R8G66_18210 [Cytophagales bacterium]|nr:hypothetical protein [Cytophagales bacterium]
MKEYQTSNYLIQVDQIKNLIMIRPIGFWNSALDVSDYLPTIRYALDHDLETDFLVICDLSEMKSASKKVRDEFMLKLDLKYSNVLLKPRFWLVLKVPLPGCKLSICVRHTLINH